VVVVAGDSVQSLDRYCFHSWFQPIVRLLYDCSPLIYDLHRSAEFLKRADASCSSPDNALASPVIPNGYDRVARWHMEK
jgi:hypothetical protein